MVVKMMKWSSPSKKFQVKVKPLKLEGFNLNLNGCDQDKEEKVIVVKMKWRGHRNSGLVSLHRHSLKNRRNVSNPVFVRQGEVIQWDDAFENMCSFSIFQKDNSFHPWDVSFNLLHGRFTEPTNKLAVIGSVSLNIAELASLMEPQIERKLPVSVRVAGVSAEATLLVSVSFVEIRNSQDTPVVVQDAVVGSKEDGFLGMGNDLKYVSRRKKKKKKKKKKQSPADDGDMSDDSYSGVSDEPDTNSEAAPELDQDSKESPGQCSTSSTGNYEVELTKEEPSVSNGNGSDRANSAETQLESSLSQATRLDFSASKKGFFSWKRRLSFVSAKGKEKPLIKKTEAYQNTGETSTVESSSKTENDDGDITVGSWEEKELISRDGQAKLKTNVFFASMDQRSEKAAGASACTALVTVIANWLHLNRDAMPSMYEFDHLIIEGSSEWRKLCDNELFIQRFPDKHFDLETVLRAELRPLCIKPEKSFVGFFCPEKFESLKGAMSFDGIWDEISSSNVNEAEAKVYIVSWNDHFFVLKVEADAYYIIDTLGERLFEGCNKAYILKFDDRASLYRLPETATKEGKRDEGGSETEGGESESLICSGKESCREFIKRFFAAIPLKEMEEEEEKGTASIVSLHQRLQIELHFSSASTNSSSSSSSPLLSSSSHSPSSSLSSSSDDEPYCVQ